MIVRDRLLAQEQVIPTLSRLRASLIGLAAGSAVSLGLLYLLPQPVPPKPAFISTQYGNTMDEINESWSRPNPGSKTSYRELLRKYEPWGLIN